MTTAEQADLIDTAEEGLTTAIDALRDLVRSAPARWRDLDSYIIAHLVAWRDGDNRYDATALPRLRERFDEDEEDDVVEVRP